MQGPVAATSTGTAPGATAARRGRPAVRALVAARMAASTLVLVLAALWGAWATAYGLWVWAALTLSWMADALLSSRRSRLFLAGLAGVLAARAALVVAFGRLGPTPWVVLAAMLALGLVAYLFMAGPLLRAVPGRLRRPAVAFAVVLVLVVALAAGAAHTRGQPVVLLGAVLLLVADLSMVRQRFVRSDGLDAVVGWPAYYAAQTLLAYSVTAIGGGA